jgi:hypothetical protein
MECPECKNGRIRVIIDDMTCFCDYHRYHSLICDHCFAYFNIKCDKPFGEKKLPPEFPMIFDEDRTKKFKTLCERVNVNLLQLVTSLPLLEEFKLAQTQ